MLSSLRIRNAMTPVTATINRSQLLWDLKNQKAQGYLDYWNQKQYSLIPPTLFDHNGPVWLEIGAGTGGFFSEMARLHPDCQMIAIERCRERGKRLVNLAKRSALPNFHGFRGNAIPVVLTGIPNGSVDRIYILYPCPWPRHSQRKNRWYLHPMMVHLYRILKPGGVLIWASDQSFYIEEAAFVCCDRFGMQNLAQGPVGNNPFNGLSHFEGGRTKFERTFLQGGLPCFELVVQRTESLDVLTSLEQLSHRP